MQTGTYKLLKDSFFIGNRKLVIKKRKKKTSKPELYLIQLSPFEYVSSLFPVPTTSPGEEFTFDFQNRLYALRKIKNQVEVVELGETPEP